MKIFSANIESLSDLFTNELAKTLDLEESIAEILPRMIDRASDPRLKRAFRDYLQQTQAHVIRIKRLLRDESSTNCRVIRALVSETEDMIKDVTDSRALDFALISCVQQIKHHEISVYGTLRSWARRLGRSEALAILGNIENDEREGDRSLNEIIDRVMTEVPVAA